jgi:ferric-dicitrate binding protein FerR (iron transport regulator)
LSQSNFDHLLQKYLAGECTEEEEKLVLEWYHKLIANSDLHLSETERSSIEARLWNTIQTNVQEPPALQPAKVKPITPHWRRNWFRVAAAAAVLTVIVTAIVLYRQPAGKNTRLAIVQPQADLDSVVNITNTARKFQLTDSTLITLQPGAVVYYPASFSGATREVYLHGSAFFNVHHDPQKHFKVHLNNELTTEVLGTSFNITQNQTDWNVEVAVVTGKVLVYRQTNNKTAADSTGQVVLTRNKKVTFNAELNQLITSIVDNPLPQPNTKMPTGAGSQAAIQQFVFEEASLQEVLQQLSDAYGILIKADNEQIGGYHFTGDLSKYSLFTQLEIICKSTQTTYEINGSQIIVKENQNQ